MISHSRSFVLFVAFCLSLLCFGSNHCHGQSSPHAIQILTCRQEALAARLELINSAQHEILISTFYVEPGHSTNAILRALRSAAKRGVQVRLLFDGLKMELSKCEIDSLRNDGIKIREFHPTGSADLLKLNRRLHSKLFVVDGVTLILGSRNLRDKHFGLATKNYVDFEIVLQGDSVAQSVCYFNWIWNSERVGDVEGDRKRSGDDATPSCEPCIVSAFEFQPQFEAPVCALHDARLDKSKKRMQDQRIAWVNSACNSLIIETPYPVFARDSLKAIEAAAKRGVRVKLFTNSNSSTDMPITYAALQNLRRRLLKSGVEIYEYAGKETIHSKMFLVDGRFAVLGSHNFDARSDYFNLEFCVKVDSVEFTQCLESRLEQRRLESRRVVGLGLDRKLPLADRAKIRMRQIPALLIRPLL